MLNQHLKKESGRVVAKARNRGEFPESPGICSNCTYTRGIIAHHEDYAKPLEIVWLCGRCHKRRHMEFDPDIYKRGRAENLVLLVSLRQARKDAASLELSKFIELGGESKKTVAKKTGRAVGTIYGWLKDDGAEYTIHYAARNNRIIRVDRRLI